MSNEPIRFHTQSCLLRTVLFSTGLKKDPIITITGTPTGKLIQKHHLHPTLCVSPAHINGATIAPTLYITLTPARYDGLTLKGTVSATIT